MESNTEYIYDQDLHPVWRAVLAHNTYNISKEENLISATSLMKPTHMSALERHNKHCSKEINLEAMIPSVYGTAIHAKVELALDNTSLDTWKLLGVPDPTKLEVLQEVRNTRELEGYIVSGQFDVMMRYAGDQWVLMDVKSMSVWAMMIDPAKKKEEWVKQLSIYRWLNPTKDINDIANILFIYTDWSAAESKRKPDYPQSRIGTIEITLWSIEETEKYIVDKLKQLSKATSSLTSSSTTGYACSDEELWRVDPKFKYYKPNKSGTFNMARATKNFDTYPEAHAHLLKDGSVGKIVETPGEVKRCRYCSVLNFCEQGKSYKVMGLIKD